MITGLQVALAGGALIGLGLAGMLIRLAPAEPDLNDVAARLSPDARRRRVREQDRPPGELDGTERLGLWAIKHVPGAAWGATPTKELALLRIPVQRHYGKKLFQAFVGLLIPPLLLALFTALGWGLPILLPAGASLALAAFLFFAPDLDVRADARRARTEFSRALGAYIDLVALERAGGSGPRQAMEVAAEIGDSWVFQRIGEELARSRWAGQAPWEALRALADELGLPELSDLADIVRLSGEEGAQIYQTLRARSEAMRTAMLNTELAKANAIGEKMSIPMSLLGVIFMAILVAPALLRVMTG